MSCTLRTWGAPDCSVWFEWFSIIQGSEREKELQRFLYSLLHVCFKHEGAHAYTQHGKVWNYKCIPYIHTDVRTSMRCTHKHVHTVAHQAGALKAETQFCQKKLGTEIQIQVSLHFLCMWAERVWACILHVYSLLSVHTGLVHSATMFPQPPEARSESRELGHLSNL